LIEFPHELAILIESEPTPDGGGGYKKGEWIVYDEIKGFMDTPSSHEVFQAHQLQHPFDRHLYYPYRKDINSNMRVLFDGDTYEFVGKPMDQGGQQEVMKANLRLING